MKILFLVLDGLGDRPIGALGDKTPLEAADTPNLDYMVENGTIGEMQPFKFFNEEYPTSEGAHIGMFGYKDFFLGRGPYEAAGINMPLDEGDVAMRVNFATVNEDGIITDRRAGRISDTENLIKAISGIEINGIKFYLKKSNGHRAVLVMSGMDLSCDITSNDSHEKGLKPLLIEARNPDAERTAQALNEFLEKAHEILDSLEENKQRDFPANYLLVRGAGTFKKIYSFEDKYGIEAACVAGGGLYKGIGRMLGMDVYDLENATADINTDLWDKFEVADKALEDHDFVFLHIKGTDNCSHDGNYLEKKEFIEKIDQYLKNFLNRKDLLIVVTADHSTPCELKEHSNDPVPILIYGDGIDEAKHFSEKDAKTGGLGFFKSTELLDKLLKEYE